MLWWRMLYVTFFVYFLAVPSAYPYESDVHYHLTKFLAQWVGFSDSDAEQIAAADQELDTKPEFNPMPNQISCLRPLELAGAGAALTAIPVACKNDPEFQRMLAAQRAYHFVDGKRLRELRDSAFGGKNVKILGHYLHALQDTFAHSLMDYSDLPPLDKLVASLGHLPDEKILGHLLYGHSVDKTHERPDLAEFMAKYVYKELTEFQGSANRWNDVEAAVARFVREKDLQKQVRYLSAPSPPAPPHPSSHPSGLPSKSQEPLYEGRSLVDWQAELRDPSSEVREKATQALGHFGDKAVPILAQALKDTDPDVRWAAAYALGEIGPAAKDAVPALVQALEDPDAMVRGRAEVTLRRIDPAVVEKWEQAEKAAEQPRKAEAGSASSSQETLLIENFGLKEGLVRKLKDHSFYATGYSRSEWVLPRIKLNTDELFPVMQVREDERGVAYQRDIFFYAIDGQGIWLYAHSEAPFVTYTRYDIGERHYVLRMPIDVGTEWKYETQSARYTIITTYKIIGREDVLSREGSAICKSAVKVQQKEVNTQTKEWKENVEWFCKGIGKVKEKVLGKGLFGGRDEERILVKIPQSPAPTKYAEAARRVIDRIAESDIKKRSVEETLASYLRRYSVQELIKGCKPVETNPFAFEGRRIASVADLLRMITRDRGIFRLWVSCDVVVSNIPPGTLPPEKGTRVLMAAKVLGNTELEGRLVPHLEFVGAHKCRNLECSDILTGFPW